MDIRFREVAEGTVRGSIRHVVLSTILFALVLVFEISASAGPGVYAGVLGIYAFLVTYNIVRIHRARSALAHGEDAVRAFADGQRRSHRVRGRTFLVTAPIIVIGGWVLALRSTDTKELVAMAIATVVLVFGWVTWWRTLTRMAEVRRDDSVSLRSSARGWTPTTPRNPR